MEGGADAEAEVEVEEADWGNQYLLQRSTSGILMVCDAFHLPGLSLFQFLDAWPNNSFIYFMHFINP